MAKTIKKLCIASVLAMLMSAQSSQAASNDGSFVIRGIGYQKCSHLNKDYQQNRLKQIELSSWISGYVTHTNSISRSTIDLLPIQDTSQFAAIVALMCYSQSEAQIQKVVEALVNYFKPLGTTAKGDFVNTKSGTYQVGIRGETMEAIQTLLAQKGLLNIEDVDGEFGPKTSIALSAFQEQTAGLQKTGVPDILTLYALLQISK